MLFDTRPGKEYAVAHIPGSINSARQALVKTALACSACKELQPGEVRIRSLLAQRRLTRTDRPAAGALERDGPRAVPRDRAPAGLERLPT